MKGFQEMACYHPLQAIRTPDLVERKDRKGFYNKIRIVASQAEPLKSYPLTIQATGEVIDVDPFKIPCGKCIGCRLDYAKAWANRMTLESITMTEDYKTALQNDFLTDLRWQANEVEFEPWFITFTYDDFHLPHGEYTDDGISYPSLFQKDFQDFLKRLRIDRYRKYGYEGSIKYYYAGEYGDTTSRPHYHAIMWYLPLYKLRPYARTALGDQLYNDDDITTLWGKGHVVIAKSTWSTCAYTARYVMKKQTMTHSEYCDLFDNINIEPPYVRMSRNPGIGLQFYEKNKKKIYMNDQIILPAKTKGSVFKVKPPHIFDTKYAEEFPFELIEIKKERQMNAKLAEKNLLAQTNIDPIEYLIGTEEKKKKTIQSLKRRL